MKDKGTDTGTAALGWAVTCKTVAGFDLPGARRRWKALGPDWIPSEGVRAPGGKEMENREG